MNFQRARRPEQLAARRAAILQAARAAVGEKGVADVSLRDISERVGLAKSNVLRYFHTREALLLELLAQEFRGWLDAVGARLGRPRQRKPGYASEIRVATTIAESLVERRLLCELVGAMAGVLERNITTEFARDFKLRATANIDALAQLVSRQLPWLPAESAAGFAEGALALTAGMYPFSVPTEPVRIAMAELNFPDPGQRFAAGLRAGLVTWLIGAAARSEA
ncbi:TetR family transcriptional regulator [Mycobacterium talmoniae]|uniref:TetR family transcriptional regulator n=1 Tax=Mycobacterium talmoniae TaxID=1858794 RepID=UPI000AD43A5D|nr:MULTISPECIES: TetR family transcriptional regulator [Mycobacterium]